MNEETVKLGRVDVYDIAKGIGIICIVLGHLLHIVPKESNMYMFIYNFHVPLFIVLSGCVINFDNMSFNKCIEKRFKGIIIPYVFSSIISILYMPYADNDFSVYLNTILLGSSIGGGYLYNAALWYCPMIFAASAWFYLLYSLASKYKYKNICFMLMIIGSTVCGSVLIKYGIHLPWSIETGLIAQIYIFLGWQFKTLIEKAYSKKECAFMIGVLAVICSIYIKTYSINGLVDMNYGVYNNIIIYAFNSFLGIAAVLMISILIRKTKNIWKIFSYLGKNSLYIMLFHLPGFKFAQGQITELLPNVIRESIGVANIIGILYWLVMSILFSLFWGYVYRALVKKEC